MGKKNEWINKNINLKSLSEGICNFLEEDNFSEVKLFEDANGTSFKIQARKKGVGKVLTGRRKAFHILIEGIPNNFKVFLKREMGKNYLYGGLVGVGLNVRYQKKLWKFIENSIEILADSNMTSDPPHSYGNAINTYVPDKEKSENKISDTKSIQENIQDDPVNILKKRLALGEINKDEYQELHDILQSSSEQNSSVTIEHQEDSETKFWGCPKCSGPLEDQKGQQYCKACNEFA